MEPARRYVSLFRSLNMTPVFFGENMFGTRLPSLTYMLAFEDMTARYKARCWLMGARES